MNFLRCGAPGQQADQRRMKLSRMWADPARKIDL